MGCFIATNNDVPFFHVRLLVWLPFSPAALRALLHVFVVSHANCCAVMRRGLSSTELNETQIDSGKVLSVCSGTDLDRYWVRIPAIPRVSLEAGRPSASHVTICHHRLGCPWGTTAQSLNLPALCFAILIELMDHTYVQKHDRKKRVSRMAVNGISQFVHHGCCGTAPTCRNLTVLPIVQSRTSHISSYIDVLSFPVMVSASRHMFVDRGAACRKHCVWHKQLGGPLSLPAPGGSPDVSWYLGACSFQRLMVVPPNEGGGILCGRGHHHVVCRWL